MAVCVCERVARTRGDDYQVGVSLLLQNQRRRSWGPARRAAKTGMSWKRRLGKVTIPSAL